MSYCESETTVKYFYIIKAQAQLRVAQPGQMKTWGLNQFF